MSDVMSDFVTCPHCGEISNLGGLIGVNTNDCPRCGKPVLGNKMKTYSATVVISFAVEVEVEAENEDDARQLLDEKAWESYFKTTGESELYDFMEVRP